MGVLTLESHDTGESGHMGVIIAKCLFRVMTIRVNTDTDTCGVPMVKDTRSSRGQYIIWCD